MQNIILAESQWFSPDHGSIGNLIKDVQKNYKQYTEKAKRQAFYSKTNFSWDKMKEKLDNLLSSNIPQLPKQIELKLPNLNLPTF